MERIGSLLFRPFIGAIVFLFLLPGMVLSEIPATVHPDRGGADEAFLLSVTVPSGEEVQAPNFESSENFAVELRGTTSQFSSINGRQESSTKFSFLVVPRRGLPPGKYDLPSGTITVGGRSQPLSPLSVEITPPRKKSRDKSGTINIVQVVGNAKPYIGEQITHQVELATSVDLVRIDALEGSFPGFWRESLGEARKQTREFPGTRTRTYGLVEAIFPKQVGALVIPERGMETQRQVAAKAPHQEWSIFDEVWPQLGASGFQTVKETYFAEPVSVEVQPLPPPPVSNLSYIPVGEMHVGARLDKRSVKYGDGVTLAIELKSDGNLRPYELPLEQLKGFRIYPERPTVSTEVVENRVIFRKLFTVALVPERSGEVVLSSMRIVSFDPRAGEYRFSDTPSYKIEVTGEPPPSSPATKRGGEREERLEIVREESEVPPLKSGEGSPTRRAFLSHREQGEWYLLALLLPPLLVIGAWLRGIFRRGRNKRTDPLADALKQISEAKDSESILQAVRAYLGHRFQVEPESLTAKEVSERLAARGVQSARVVDYLYRWERARYGGGGFESGEAGARERDEGRVVLQEVDRCFS